MRSHSHAQVHHASRRPHSPDLLKARNHAVELLDAIKKIKAAGDPFGLANWYRDAQPNVPFDPVPNRLPSLIRAFDAALRPLLHELWQAFSGTVRVGNVSAKTHFEAAQKLADDVCGVLLLAIRARQPLDEPTVSNLKELQAARQLPDFDFSLSQVDCEIVPKYVRRMVHVSYADIEFLKEAVTSEAIDLQKQRAIRDLVSANEMAQAPGQAGAVADQAPDDDAYVLVSSLWSERFPSKRYRSAEAKAILDTARIRYRKPQSNRLEVHAGDWARYWADQGRRAAADGDESLTGDRVETPVFLENAGRMYAKIMREKQGRQ